MNCNCRQHWCCATLNIVLIVYPPTYYMLITQLNSTSTFFLQSYVILSPVLLYVVLIYIYKLYVYCSVPSYYHQKQIYHPTNPMCRCDLWNFEPNPKSKWYRIPNTYWIIPNCTNQINQNEPNQQNNLLISCITHYDGMAHTLYNQNPMLPQPITPQKAYHAFITWALVVAVTMPWF